MAHRVARKSAGTMPCSRHASSTVWKLAIGHPTQLIPCRRNARIGAGLDCITSSTVGALSMCMALLLDGEESTSTRVRSLSQSNLIAQRRQDISASLLQRKEIIRPVGHGAPVKMDWTGKEHIMLSRRA